MTYMRILLPLIAFLSFVAIPLVDCRTLTPSPRQAASAAPHKRARKPPSVAPAATGAPTQSTTPTNAPTANATTVPTANGQVWVNTKTGVYHYPGSRWYGNTKAGKYISEQDAIKEGDRPAKNGQ
jgi:hypothetical protein